MNPTKLAMMNPVKMTSLALAIALLGACGSTQHLPAASGSVPGVAAGATAQADGDVTAATVNGIQVIVKRIPGAELVTGGLFIKGGVRNWGKDDAGVEQLAMAVAANGGTETTPKDAFARRLAVLGSTVEGGARDTYAAMVGKSLVENWDVTFALLAEAFLHPAMPASEIELQRAQQLAGLKHEQESPDARVTLLARQMVFKGHPYENRSVGTLETVAKLDRAALVAHLAKLRETHRLLFVVAGDVDPNHAIAQVREAFGGLPPGSYVQTPLPIVAFTRPNLQAVAQKLPTSYVVGQFQAPTWRDPDFAAGMVAIELLNWREFEEVRTKRNLSYAPHARLDTGLEQPLGALYVTAVDPNTTVRVLFGEAKRLHGEPVPVRELEGDKSVFLTSYLMASETTDGQILLLATAQILGGDWRLARTLPERIRAVTVADVQAFATKYIGRLQTVVLGDAEHLDPATFNSL